MDDKVVKSMLTCFHVHIFHGMKGEKIQQYVAGFRLEFMDDKVVHYKSILTCMYISLYTSRVQESFLNVNTNYNYTCLHAIFISVKANIK